jgi:hypothetical protein
MTHALAEVVLVEQFRPGALGRDMAVEGIGVDCPACEWTSGAAEDLGEMLTFARRHILDEHAGGERLDHEHAYTAVLHAVDAIEGDPYPALIPEPLMAEARPGLGKFNRCEACGRTVRGPLLPLYRADRAIQLVGPGCFRARRQNVSHVADPLPMPSADGAP